MKIINRIKNLELLVVLFILLLLGACDIFKEEKLTLQIQGTVMNASDDSPINNAEVELYDNEWSGESSGGTLVKDITNQQGHYSITWTEGNKACDDYVFRLFSTKSGYRWYEYTETYYKLGICSTYVHCKDDIQTINFRLEKIN